jgi:hypothetical protein
MKTNSKTKNILPLFKHLRYPEELPILGSHPPPTFSEKKDFSIDKKWVD